MCVMCSTSIQPCSNTFFTITSLHSSSECKRNEVNESWQCMCACATTEKRSFVCCYESMPVARCYSRSRDQVEIDQKREYISVNGKGGLFQFTNDVVTMVVSQCVTDLLW